MVLGFKRRFAPFVEDGSKTHSIREDKNDRWRPGVIVDAFVDPRQKTMRRLMPPTPCIYTEPLEMIAVSQSLVAAERIVLVIDGRRLDLDESNLFAWRDGFRHEPVAGIDFSIDDENPGYSPKTEGCYAMMLQFWADLDRKLTWRGKIVHWRYPNA
jgi:hypothetical protein